MDPLFYRRDYWRLLTFSPRLNSYARNGNLPASCAVEGIPLLLLFATEYHERSGHGVSEQIANRMHPSHSYPLTHRWVLLLTKGNSFYKMFFASFNDSSLGLGRRLSQYLAYCASVRLGIDLL